MALQDELSRLSTAAGNLSPADAETAAHKVATLAGQLEAMAQAEFAAPTDTPESDGETEDEAPLAAPGPEIDDFND